MISSAILAFAASPLAVLASIGSTNTTIDTTSGKVQGVPSEYVSSDITVFRGIPFAASTAGNNRWKAPQDPTKWNGTKIMSTFGPSCPQSGTTDTTSEDCLSLNIWLPPGTNTNSSLPVYLWIYGGLEAAGASDLPVYDGAGLANKGVIQIGANYRKGIFGYLALSELTAESSYNSSGNYGFLDHIKALEWIRDNIANFGGDPHHLTIGGQSAGSAATQQLLYSPLSQGLFSSAIIQSGVHDPYDPTTATVASNYVPSLAIAEAGGLSVAQNISAPTLSQLRNLSMDTLVEAQSNYTSYEGSSLWAVNLDGYVIAHTYYEGLLDSSLADVPILTGNVKDENGVSLSGVSLETYQEYVTENYGNLTEQVYALYPATDNTSATTAYNTLIRDNTKVTTYLWSKLWNTHRTSALYSYFWVHGQPIADAASQGAFHGSEMNYVFDTLGPVYGQDPGAVANWTTEDYQLADKMSTLWANFIKSHSPNAGNLTGWGVSALNATMTYQLGQNMTMIQLVDDDKKISLIEEWYAQSTRVY